MDEYQIECKVERATDRLDKRFMSGAIHQAEYDAEIVALDKWSQQQYDALKSAPFKTSREEC